MSCLLALQCLYLTNMLSRTSICLAIAGYLENLHAVLIELILQLYFNAMNTLGLEKHLICIYVKIPVETLYSV